MRKKLLSTPIDSEAYIRYVERLNERSFLKHEIMDAPSVEAVPVVHGEWEECDWVEYEHGECIHYSREALRCSNCCNAFKKELLYKDNFCPNCGADMRKKV